MGGRIGRTGRIGKCVVRMQMRQKSDGYCCVRGDLAC